MYTHYYNLMINTVMPIETQLNEKCQVLTAPLAPEFIHSAILALKISFQLADFLGPQQKK